MLSLLPPLLVCLLTSAAMAQPPQNGSPSPDSPLPPTLAASIQSLLDRYDDDTRVHPGHMGLTTLGAERATNPFLGSLTS